MQKIGSWILNISFNWIHQMEWKFTVNQLMYACIDACIAFCPSGIGHFVIPIYCACVCKYTSSSKKKLVMRSSLSDYIWCVYADFRLQTRTVYFYINKKTSLILWEILQTIFIMVCINLQHAVINVMHTWMLA